MKGLIYLVNCELGVPLAEILLIVESITVNLVNRILSRHVLLYSLQDWIFL